MIYTRLPFGTMHGWGICGKYLTLELCQIATAKHIINADEMAQKVSNPLQYQELDRHRVTTEQVAQLQADPEFADRHVCLHAILGKGMQPLPPFWRARRNIGYTFFEENVLATQALDDARRNYDVVVAGSSWCEEVLRGYGLSNVTTIVQGVDPQIFHAIDEPKHLFRDRFVIFSGGKFEFRKGQDIVIRAFKALQDRYDDILLVAAWYNNWPAVMQSMSASNHISFSIKSDDFLQVMRTTLAQNGIDLGRVILVPCRSNFEMAWVYRNTDIGLFPNRCEGGTNLVLMEYMACGKPVIASFNAGHKDVLTAENSIRIEQMQPLTVKKDERPIAEWYAPDLDETIAHLQWAYQHREALEPIGRQAAADVGRLTWRKAAQEFLTLLQK